MPKTCKDNRRSVRDSRQDMNGALGSFPSQFGTGKTRQASPSNTELKCYKHHVGRLLLEVSIQLNVFTHIFMKDNVE